MTAEGQINPAMIRTAIDQARQSARQIGDLQAANARTIRTLETALNQAIKGALNEPFKAFAPPQRRTEIRSRIEADPELRAFILAHISTLTFDQVLAQIETTFGRERLVSRSALHRWWHRYGKRSGEAQSAAIT